MVRECLSPDCREQLRSLAAGHVYVFERRNIDTEFFWLCPACARRFDLVLDANGTVTRAERSGRTLRTPLHPDRHLRGFSFGRDTGDESHTTSPKKPVTSIRNGPPPSSSQQETAGSQQATSPDPQHGCPEVQLEGIMKRKVTRISAREKKPVQTAQLYHPAVDRRCLAVQFDAYESSFLAERGCFHLPDHEQLHTRIPQSA